jgi:hypothetical protein
MDNNDIDPAIRLYINKINEFPFVETVLSCQGHYKKTAMKSVYFYRYILKSKKSELGLCITDENRCVNPYVLLKFSGSSAAAFFVKLWRVMRPLLYELCDKLVIYINDRNEDYILSLPNIPPRCFIVSLFDDIYVSVSYSLISGKYTRYHKMKLKMNEHIELFRGILYTSIINALEIMQEHLVCQLYIKRKI